MELIDVLLDVQQGRITVHVAADRIQGALVTPRALDSIAALVETPPEPGQAARSAAARFKKAKP